MEQTKEDLENIKSKLLEHIKSNYDETQANEFTTKINSMNDEEFVEFLKQQGMLGEKAKQEQCIFCSMIFGDIPTTKIGENEKAIAILEINPISKGHALVIPKEHVESVEKFPEEVKLLAGKIKEKLIKTFNPKQIEITPGNIMGHYALNVFPVYNEEKIDSPRQKETPEGLAKIQEEIEEIQQEEIQPKEEIKEEEINEKNTWLPKRIP
jgi:histidine triad (HIT) family protein